MIVKQEWIIKQKLHYSFRKTTMMTKNKTNLVDGYTSILFIMLYGLVIFVPYDDVTSLSAVFSIVLLFALFITLKLRKQKMDSLGFSSQKYPYAMVLLVTLCIIAVAILTDNTILIHRWLFYLVVVACPEEVIFRGYASSRLLFLFRNRLLTTIIVGCVYGIFHAKKGVLNNGWQVALNYIGGGIVSHAAFLYIYEKSGSIVNSILIHAALDFSRYMPPLMIVPAMYLIIPLLKKYVTIDKIRHIVKHKAPNENESNEGISNQDGD